MNLSVKDSVAYSLHSIQNPNEQRNQLVCKYLHLAEIIARKLYPVYSSFAEPEDMINTGVIALMSAVERYDPSMGVKFETYASVRIRGAILDYIRKNNWVPRTVWDRSREIETTFNKLSAKLGREPNDSEMIKELGITPEEYAKRMKDAHLYTLVSYEDVLAENYSAVDQETQQNDTPSMALIEKETKQELIEAIENLSEKERLVVTLYYYEELKLKEIAEIMDVSESYVCQINTRALMKLKKALARKAEI